MSQSVYVRDARTVGAARELRKTLTDAERLLWTRLRRDQLGIRLRRQHPIGRRVVDFYAPEIRLAVEIDGGQHAVEAARDTTRSRELVSGGVAVLRFWNNEVMENMDGVLSAITTVIAHLRAPSSPSPLGLGPMAPQWQPPLRSGGGDASGDLAVLNLRLLLPETAA